MQLSAPLLDNILKLISIALLLGINIPRLPSPETRLNAILQEQQRLVNEPKVATAPLLLTMSKQQSLEARLRAMWQKQQRLVRELKAATPARERQIKAEIVTLTEERTKVLQEAGENNCFIHTISGAWGTIWIEEKRYSDGSRQYKYGYYRDGRSHRQYVPNYLVEEVRQMIAASAQMGK